LIDKLIFTKKIKKWIKVIFISEMRNFLQGQGKRRFYPQAYG
jgi:hypothetical protein